MKRTDKQNRSLWKWDKMMVDYFNRHDKTIQWVLSHTFERRWMDEDFVRLMVRPTLKEWLGNPSTSQATTKQLITVSDALIDNLSIHVASETGEPIPPWPDRYSQQNEN